MTRSEATPSTHAAVRGVKQGAFWGILTAGLTLLSHATRGVGILKGERSLAAELVLCLAIVPIVGAIAGYLAPLARSRGRAALVGVVAVLPFAMFVAFTLTPESLRAADLSNTFRLFFGLFSAVVLGAVGGVGYYVGWHARARGERHGA